MDTANNYQNEQSEEWIGEWMEKKQNRDFMVIATKFTTNYRMEKDGKGRTVNYCGNHKKSLHLSLRDSLKKLKTSYLDILYVHWVRHNTSGWPGFTHRHSLTMLTPFSSGTGPLRSRK